MSALKVTLISTYDLGHQPFGLASPAAWLREAGAQVRCLDLAVQALDAAKLAGTDLLAVHLPMHTATRLAADVLPDIRRAAPDAHLCFFGLYAPMNEPFLRAIGGQTTLGGEFENGLLALYRRLCREGATEDQTEPVISLAKQRFRVPDREGLPGLSKYAYLTDAAERRRLAGYTEASRGCKHLCRHCPVVPVYDGRFRVVQREVVMADVRQQVAAGAEHITFGDPDFFNGVGHGLRLVEDCHTAFPDITDDVTIKVEHLLRHAEHLSTLVRTGCLFGTTAVESLDDTVLSHLHKGHTRADFSRLVAVARKVGLNLAPTFLPFTPWTTLPSYRALLAALADLRLIDCVVPVQLAIRLLLPEGSRLLGNVDVRGCLEGFDDAGLSHRWRHPDTSVDRLQALVQGLIQRESGQPRHQVFGAIWRLAHEIDGCPAPPLPDTPCVSMPRLSEPWYCCAEPLPAGDQMVP